MTDENNPCVVCGSTNENFDKHFCCKACYEVQEERYENKKTILDLSTRANDSLLIGAQALYDCGCFNNETDVIHFFEKPHRYKVELEELGYEIKL